MLPPTPYNLFIRRNLGKGGRPVFLLLPLLLGLVIFSGCFGSKETPPPAETIKPAAMETVTKTPAEETVSPNTPPILTPETIQEDTATFDQAVQNNDETDCASILDPDLKHICEQKILFKKAVDAKDPAECQKLSGESLQKDCLEQIK